MATPIPFNATWYLSQNPDVAAAVEAGLIDAETHFQQFGRFEGRSASFLLDVEYYLANNPDVAEAVRAGTITAWDHAVQFGMSEGRVVTRVFDEAFYLQSNPDIAQAVASGQIQSGLQHFVLFGHTESRPVNPVLDLEKYLAANPDVAEAAAAGVIDPLAHLMTYGITEGRSLGNGIQLPVFDNDPLFTGGLAASNHLDAWERVKLIAPFVPTFERPAGWTPPANTPIPVDFVPPAGSGLKLVVPPEVVVPPGVTLPDQVFAPGNGATPTPNPAPNPNPGTSNNDGSGGGSVFALAESTPGSKVWSLSAGNGNVSVTATETQFVFTPTTGSSVSKAKADVSGLIVDTITLSGEATVLATIPSITGAVTLTTAHTLAQLKAINAATTGTITLFDNSVELSGTAQDVTTALDGIIGYAGSITLTDTGALSAGVLSTIRNSTTGSVTASSVTSVTGTAADVAALMGVVGTSGDKISLGTITEGSSNVGVTVSGTYTLTQLKTINDATSGSIVLQDKSVTLEGSSVDVAAALDGITGYTGNIILSDAPSLDQLKAINGATSGTISLPASGLLALDGSAADLAQALQGITGYSGSVTLTDPHTLAQLKAINDATTGTLTLNKLDVALSGSPADVLAALDGITGYSGAITFTTPASIAQWGSVDALTSGAISGQITDSIEHANGKNFSTDYSGNTGVTLTGSGGVQTVTGSAANDTIAGGAGADVLDGGDGVDTVSYADVSDASSHGLTGGLGVVVNLGATSVSQADIMTAFAPASVFLGGRSAAGSDDAPAVAGASAAYIVNSAENAAVAVTGHRDTLTGFESVIGSSLNDYIVLGSVGMRADGGSGKDYIVGGSGADTLLGGNDADTLLGNDGNDILVGGAGADVLTGGAGNDTFKYLQSGDTAASVSDYASMDVLDGFKIAEDKIDISAMTGYTPMGTPVRGSWNGTTFSAGSEGDDWRVSWGNGSTTNYVILKDTEETGELSVTNNSGVLSFNRVIPPQLTTLAWDGMQHRLVDNYGASASYSDRFQADIGVTVNGVEYLNSAIPTIDGLFRNNFINNNFGNSGGISWSMSVNGGGFVSLTGTSGTPVANQISINSSSPNVSLFDFESTLFDYTTAKTLTLRGTYQETSLDLGLYLGSSAVDTLTGTAGSNMLVGRGGVDTLTGGNGKDVLIAGNLQNNIFDPVTSAGATLNGGGGDDYLYGDQGADTFSGGVGDDTLYLGDDSAVDTVVFASSAADNGSDFIYHFKAGLGKDRLDFAAFISGGVAADSAADADIFFETAEDASAVDIGGKLAVVAGAVGAFDQAAEIAALFGGAGAMFANALSGHKAVVHSGSTSNGVSYIWYVNDSASDGVTATDIQLVATLNTGSGIQTYDASNYAFVE